MISLISNKKQKLSRCLDIQEGITYNQVKTLLKNKDIKINGERVKEDCIVNQGDEIIAYIVKKEKSIKTLYQDDNIVALYKNKGIASPDFANKVQHLYPNAKLMHRLDTNTDGILLFSLNNLAYNEIYQAFKNRTLIKKYHALVYGRPPIKNEILTAYYKKDKINSRAIISDQEKKDTIKIITEYTIKKYNSQENTTLLDVTLHTGKTHQIRAHLSHIGLPIIGDGKYGNEQINRKFKCKKQQLTFYFLSFNFPSSSPLFYLNNLPIKI